jgi:hypothetical protein
MKYMGWSWEDLCQAPKEIVREIIEIINEEAEKQEQF